MPNIFVVSAPSGAGKTSLVKGVCDIFDFIKPAISITTRKMRDSEIDGQDYYYVSESKFQDMIGNEEFLEYERGWFGAALSNYVRKSWYERWQKNRIYYFNHEFFTFLRSFGVSDQLYLHFQRVDSYIVLVF